MTQFRACRGKIMGSRHRRLRRRRRGWQKGGAPPFWRSAEDRANTTIVSDLESGPRHSTTSPLRILMLGKGTAEGLPQTSASASLRAVKKKSKRKGRSDRNHWFFFRGGEPAHRIGSRSETQLLTACGLHFHPLTATPMQQGCNGPKCQTCVRARP